MGPDFLVIGTTRSGTTFLHQHLRSHPRLWLPPQKELHYLSYQRARGFGNRKHRKHLRRAAPRLVDALRGKRGPLAELSWQARYLLGPRNDRWFRRRLDDSSTDLQTPTALLYRYPYLYVGTESALLRYDGGRWDQFEIGVEVTALGWHNARLYIGTDDGSLLTLEGTVLETVVSPEAGAVRSILRFDRGRRRVPPRLTRVSA